MLVLFDGWTSFFRDRVVPWRIGMAEKLRAAARERSAAALHRARSAGTRQRASRSSARDRGPRRLGRWAASAGCSRFVDVERGASYFLPLALGWEDATRSSVRALSPRRHRAGAPAGERRRDGRRVRGRGVLPPRGQGDRRGRRRCRPRTASCASCRPRAFAQHRGRRGGEPHRSAALHTQSTNTSVTLGDRLFLKGYRRLRRGVNPELEIGRFLTEVAHFTNCVPLAGAVEYLAEDGETCDAWRCCRRTCRTRATPGATRSRYLERFLESAAPEEDEPRRVSHAHADARARAPPSCTRASRCAPAIRRSTPEPLTAQDVEAWRARGARRRPTQTLRTAASAA